MSAAARGGSGHSRNASFSAAGPDARPPVVAQKRVSSVGHRPPLSSAPAATASSSAGTRSTSQPKAKKTGTKPSTTTASAPMSAAAKRSAAKGTSLRTRMPYLRPTATQTHASAHEGEESSSSLPPPHPPSRSFSSSASTHASAPRQRASYTAIPEALQEVKKICNASKDGTERDAPVLTGSGNGRDRRPSRPSSLSSSKSVELSEDAATVIQSIEVIQGMLFSSFQTAPSAEAFSPLSPHREAAGANFQRSRSCNAQLESPLISSASGLFISKKERRKAWALLLHKNTHTFPLLVNAARSPLAVREAKVVATILTFLYNILRHMAGERQRKSVLLCEKLGLIRTCTSVLQESRRRLRFDAANGATKAACLRACEAAGLLFTLGNTFNAKLSAAFRLSQSLDCTLACAAATFQLLEAELAAFQQSLQLDATSRSLKANIHHYTASHTRKDTLKALRGFQARMQWSCTAFSHFVFTIFVFTGNAGSAKEVGVRGAELCSTAIAMATYYLAQIAPVLLSSVVYEKPEETLHPAVGPLVALDPAHWAPAWVVKTLRHVELMLLWCVALLHRLGSCGKVQAEVCAAALQSHVPRSCLLLLATPSAEAPHLVPRRECVHVVLLLLTTLLDADRAGVLTDMRDLGGLQALVRSILALNEPAAQQWHHYYVQLATMYGCLSLPSLADHAACYIDQRIPDSLRGLLAGAALPEKVHTSPLCENTAAATSLSGRAASLSSSPCAPALASAAATAGLATGEGPQTTQVFHSTSSLTNTVETTSLSPAEKFVSVTDAALSPPSAAVGDLKDGLLLVDTQPGLFSPELHDGAVDAASALGDFHAGQLPWPFTDAAPPSTAAHWQGGPSHIANIAEDDHLRVPLKDVPQEERVRVLRHHIARLAKLDDAACDHTPNPHAHKIVYERTSGASASAARMADSAVLPSHDGIAFFSDYESGNLQRAVEVADNEYDLVLAWDTATNSYTQWFNFGVRGFTPGKTYHFNILNMEKLGSTFNEGQRPLLLHVPDTMATTTTATAATPEKHAAKKRVAPQWQRVGHHIFYFRNTYERPARAHQFSSDLDALNASTGAAAVASSPATAAPPRSSPVRSSACSPPPRLSPSRTPPPPPPVTAKRRTPAASAATTPPPSSALPGTGHDDSDGGGKKQKNYFTVTFSVTMPQDGAGQVYLTNCFPFTYTELRQHLAWLAGHAGESPTQSLRLQSLCVTPGGLEVPLLTVTALRHAETGAAYTAEEIRRRPIALLVARVHPGETNASWVMQGLLDALVRPTAATAAWSALLCETYVFKIVPMLNVDGVMMGNHRCSFAGMDMNRDYLDPKAELNPTLYAIKQLLRYWRQEEGRQAVMFADFHGHSRAKNFLVYGCTADTMRGIASHLGGKDKKEKGRSRRRVRVCQTSTDAPLGPEKFIAALLEHIFPSFSLPQSSYAVTKDKVSSARVVLYDEFGVRMSYGFEATMVGGRISTPELLLLLPPNDQSDHGATTTPAACTLWKEEVHYSPTVFRAMGDAFLRAFAVLSEQYLAATSNAEAESEEPHPRSALHRSCDADVLRALWAATAAAGGGKDAPKGRVEEAAKEASATAAPPPEPRAGPYAIATRCDRRLNAASPTTAAASADAAPLPGAVSAAGQLDALRYLFLDDLRGGAAGSMDSGDANGADDGGDAASAVGGSDDEFDRTAASAAAAVAQATGRIRRKQNGGADPDGNADGSDAGRSDASSDSGSDDHDWSGFNSSASSGEDEDEDIDVERSSASSVDDDIPTNLFT